MTIPALIRIAVLPGRRVAPTVTLGIYDAVPVHAMRRPVDQDQDQPIDGETHGDVGGLAGAGLDVRWGAGALVLELRATYGLPHAADALDAGASTGVFSVGYRFDD